MTIITSLINHPDNTAQREQMARLLSRLFKGELDPAEMFTPDYQQYTDGHALDFRGFMQHLNHVRSQIREIAFRVDGLACHENLMADRHWVTVTYPDGRRADIEVYMFAALREGKICRIHEVTQAIGGHASDRALAHATQ
ncbi:nuclear transport factor 2 family protein [Enterobacter bugandensis]|uniref:nuclear transport factor 2 family protein n=1 Tax=Enterobacter bugandensis TaxID=881260 RepID=UPI0037544DF1